MIYDLLLTRETEASVERTIDYLAKRSPQGAAAWCEQWEKVLATLKQNPLQHGLAQSRPNTTPRSGRFFSRLAAAASIGHSSLSLAAVFM